jgi:uncharacterized lipoprotein YmbA
MNTHTPYQPLGAPASLPVRSRTDQRAGGDAGAPGMCVPMRIRRSVAAITILLAGTCCLGGCFNLKPARNLERYFVLSPIHATEPAPAANAVRLAIGVGQVKVASYLLKNSLAVRQTSNEIIYVANALWAERLDGGLQRVVAANLSALLPSEQLRLSAWNREDVDLEVYIVIEQFDVDATGHGVLVAWWRLCSPGGEHLLKSGQFHGGRSGSNPRIDPQGAAALLSDLAGDLSHALVEQIKATRLSK